MADFSSILSYAQSILGLAEIQLFLGVIVIGTIVYLLIVFGKSILSFILGRRDEEYEDSSSKSMDQAFQAAKASSDQTGRLSRPILISEERIQAKDRVLLQIAIPMGMIERLIFITIIIAEIVAIIIRIR